MAENNNKAAYVKIHGVDKTSTVNVAGDKLGSYYLAQNPNEYEVQRSNNFELVITFPDTMQLVRAGSTDVSDKENGIFTNSRAQEVIRLSVDSAFVPHYTVNALEIKRGNNSFKFAGTPTFSSGTARFNDYIGTETLETLMAWQNLVYNVRTEKVGLARDYKVDATLLVYTPDYQLVRTWIYKGLWISGISEDDYNNSTNDKHMVSVTFEYDKAYVDTSEIE